MIFKQWFISDCLYSKWNLKGDDPIEPPGHEQPARQLKGGVGAQLHFSAVGMKGTRLNRSSTLSLTWAGTGVNITS